MGRVSVTMRDWSDRDRSDDCGRVELSPICDHFTIYFVYFIISDLVEIERRCMPGASLYFYRPACSSLAFSLHTSSFVLTLHGVEVVLSLPPIIIPRAVLTIIHAHNDLFPPAELTSSATTAIISTLFVVIA